MVAAAPLIKAFNLNQGFGHYDDEFESQDGVGYFKVLMRLFSDNRINLPSERRGDAVARLAIRWLGQGEQIKAPLFPVGSFL